MQFAHRATLFAHQLHNHPSRSWSRVEVDQYDLLPCSELQLALEKWDGDARTEQ